MYDLLDTLALLLLGWGLGHNRQTSLALSRMRIFLKPI